MRKLLAAMFVALLMVGRGEEAQVPDMIACVCGKVGGEGVFFSTFNLGGDGILKKRAVARGFAGVLFEVEE